MANPFHPRSGVESAATLSTDTADTASGHMTSIVEATTCTIENSAGEKEVSRSSSQSDAIRQVEESIAGMLVRTPQRTPQTGIIFKELFDKINAETVNFMLERNWLHDIQNKHVLNAWSRATNKEKGGFSRLIKSTSDQQVRVGFLFLRISKIR